jgi:hypothetical protein
MKYAAVCAALFFSSMHMVACGSDTPAQKADVDAGAPQPEAGPTRTRDAFNGDCTTANWSSTSSDACWACMCGACAKTLNVCDDGCADLMQCALDKHVLVGKTTEVTCEVRGFQAECLTDPAKQSHADAATAFDVCLIGARTPQSMLRICESECGMNYTGDVCQRYPSPDAGKN